MADNDDSVIELSASSSKALTHRKAKSGVTAKGACSPGVRDLIRLKMSQNNLDNQLMDHLKSDLKSLRSTVTCKVCFKLLYEPYTLDCGHTFCYSCLCSWFETKNPHKTCPTCRREIRHQPAPAYLIKDIVHIVVSRAELMPAGETPEDHIRLRQEESEQVDRDKANKAGTSAGLFRGWFQRTHPSFRAIRDLEDGVDRCPVCNWELEHLHCFRCELIFNSEGRLIGRGQGSAGSLGYSSEQELDEELDIEDEDGFDFFPVSTAGEGFSEFYSPPEYSARRARNGRVTRSQRGLADDLASLAGSSGTSNSDTVDEQDEDGEEEAEGSEDEETESMRDFIDDSELTFQTRYSSWEGDPESEEEQSHLESIPALSHGRRRSPARQPPLRNLARGFRAASDLVSDLGTGTSSSPHNPRRRSGLRQVENARSEEEDNEANESVSAGLSDAPVPNRRKRSRTESTSTTDDTSSIIPSRSTARIRTRVGDMSRTSRRRRPAARISNGDADDAASTSHSVSLDEDVSMSDSPNSTITGGRSAYAALASRPRRRTRANVGRSQDNTINLDGGSNLEGLTQAFRRRRHEMRSRGQAFSASTIRQPRRRAPTPHGFTDPETSDDAGTLTGISPGTTREGSEEESESPSLSSVFGTRRITRSSRQQSAQAQSSRNMPARNRRGVQR